MSHHIEFVFDVVSPYSYFAFEVLQRYRSRWDVDVEFTPAFLGGVFAATRNAPPASLPARAPYLVRDLGRCGDFYDIPVLLPPNFPSKTVRALRALSEIKLKKHLFLEKAIAAFFRRYWADGQAWNDTAEEVTNTLVAAGLPRPEAELVSMRAGDDDIKTYLKDVSAAVVERGAFGFPAIFVRKDGDADEEMYFGADRLPHLAYALGLEWAGPTPQTPNRKA